MTDKKERHVRVGEIYARRGDWITCENQHVIAMFDRKVLVGEIYDAAALVSWKQPEPKIGGPAPVCQYCSGLFWRAGNEFHFHDGWRSARPGRGLTGAGWWKKLWQGLRNRAE